MLAFALVIIVAIFICMVVIMTIIVVTICMVVLMAFMNFAMLGNAIQIFSIAYR